MHLNFIVWYWSGLCCTPTVENNQVELVIIIYHVLTGNKTTVNMKFSVKEGPYVSIGYSVWITAT